MVILVKRRYIQMSRLNLSILNLTSLTLNVLGTCPVSRSRPSCAGRKNAAVRVVNCCRTGRARCTSCDAGCHWPTTGAGCHHQPRTWRFALTADPRMTQFPPEARGDTTADSAAGRRRPSRSVLRPPAAVSTRRPRLTSLPATSTTPRPLPVTSRGGAAETCPARVASCPPTSGRLYNGTRPHPP